MLRISFAVYGGNSLAKSRLGGDYWPDRNEQFECLKRKHPTSYEFHQPTRLKSHHAP